MSREIKFRAINNDGEWCYGLPTYDLDGDIEMSKPDGYTSYGDIEETLGQYTGLKDKNGVEIYEGDIVLCLYYSPQDRDTRIVEYDKQLGFIPMQEPIDYDEVYASGEHWEVIGNIHQNPELLNDT